MGALECWHGTWMFMTSCETIEFIDDRRLLPAASIRHIMDMLTIRWQTQHFILVLRTRFQSPPLHIDFTFVNPPRFNCQHTPHLLESQVPSVSRSTYHPLSHHPQLLRQIRINPMALRTALTDRPPQRHDDDRPFYSPPAHVPLFLRSGDCCCVQVLQNEPQEDEISNHAHGMPVQRVLDWFNAEMCEQGTRKSDLPISSADSVDDGGVQNCSIWLAVRRVGF